MIQTRSVEPAHAPVPTVTASAPSITDRIAREMLNLSGRGITVTKQALLTSDCGFTSAEIDAHGEDAHDRSVIMQREDEDERRVA